MQSRKVRKPLYRNNCCYFVKEIEPSYSTNNYVFECLSSYHSLKYTYKNGSIAYQPICLILCANSYISMLDTADWLLAPETRQNMIIETSSSKNLIYLTTTSLIDYIPFP
jgi:hypothetical protein